jgi:CheY-like chemotaxis protein
MRPLLDDGIDKAARGLTTLTEVLRVVSHGDPSGRVVVDPLPVPDPIAAPQPAAAERDGSSAQPPDAVRGRVLVVEDSATILSVVKYFLELEGFDVLVAENGLLGLEIALRERPDVIVSDVMMPGMGGVEMVKALRADPRTAAVRILMLTSEASVESETEGLAAGADDYILKPVEPRRLAARVKALRARSRLTPA